MLHHSPPHHSPLVSHPVSSSLSQRSPSWQTSRRARWSAASSVWTRCWRRCVRPPESWETPSWGARWRRPPWLSAGTSSSPLPSTPTERRAIKERERDIDRDRGRVVNVRERAEVPAAKCVFVWEGARAEETTTYGDRDVLLYMPIRKNHVDDVYMKFLTMNHELKLKLKKKKRGERESFLNHQTKVQTVGMKSGL